jgi:hypothetical protein
VKALRWLAALAALAACATPQRAGDHVTVVWNRVDDVQTVCQNLANRKEVFAIRGCSKWADGLRSGERVCNIYVPTPKSEMDTQTFATLGHELLHCFDGNWHDRWGRMNPDEAAAAAGSAKKGAGAAASN